jgi:hypothetical protein
LARHEEIISEILFPHDALQERSLSGLPFLAHHGPRLLEALGRHWSVGGPAHQFVRL